MRGPEPGTGTVHAIRRADANTCLIRLHACSPLRLFTPRAACADAAWVVTSTLGGGLVGGDDIALSIEVGPAARLWLTTQASTKVYRSPRVSRQKMTGRVGDAGLLVSWPDPIAAFAGSSFEQDQQFELEAGASLVAVDAVLSGRRARGERWAFDRYVSRVSIVRDGRLVFVDALRLDGGDGPLAPRMGRFDAYAWCVLSGPAVAGAARALAAAFGGAAIARDEDVVLSVSPLDHDPAGGIVLRLAATDAERLAGVLAACLPVAASPGPVRPGPAEAGHYVVEPPREGRGVRAHTEHTSCT